MDDSEIPLRDSIRQNLVSKSEVHQKVYDNTFAAFNEVKEILNEMASELNDDLDEQLDKRIRIEYRDRGKFEAQLQAAGDVLIFSMHTDVFQFHRDHPIWQNAYVKQDRQRAYCGMISVYNFLADSLKYNRSTDEGYLIARIFINDDSRYFVEGKRQIMLRYNDFGRESIDKNALIGIVECSLNYALEFDLLVPSYEQAKIITVDQLSNKMENTKMQTGKRLGYKFSCDDV